MTDRILRMPQVVEMVGLCRLPSTTRCAMTRSLDR